MEIKSGVTIPVERNGKPVGEISFDPSDVVFAERIYDLIDGLKQAEKDCEVKAQALDADDGTDTYGLPVNARERLRFLRETCEDMHGRIDAVFGEGTSGMVFGESRSLEAIGQFFEEIAPYLENARSGKMEKYLNRDQRRAALKK